MKTSIIIAIIVALLPFGAACKRSTPPKSETGWSVCEQCDTPESVYYDSGEGVLYVANIVGAGDAKDGQGWIAKISPQGKYITPKWVEGLNAPKGMRAQNGTLWVSDIDAVVAIDQKTGAITKRIPLEGAVFANDVAIAPDGTVFVSDTIASKIYQVKGDTPSVFMEGAVLEGPNGLLYKDGKLYVAAWGKDTKPDWTAAEPGKLYAIDIATKEITPISKRIGALDGLEMDGTGNFIVSDWVAGKIFTVDKNGKAKEIYSGKQGTADIAFVPKSNLIVIPEMKESKITAIAFTGK